MNGLEIDTTCGSSRAGTMNGGKAGRQGRLVFPAMKSFDTHDIFFGEQLTWKAFSCQESISPVPSSACT
jgi:hypothetical protein